VHLNRLRTKCKAEAFERRQLASQAEVVLRIGLEARKDHRVVEAKDQAKRFEKASAINGSGARRGRSRLH